MPYSRMTLSRGSSPVFPRENVLSSGVASSTAASVSSITFVRLSRKNCAGGNTSNSHHERTMTWSLRASLMMLSRSFSAVGLASFEEPRKMRIGSGIEQFLRFFLVLKIKERNAGDKPIKYGNPALASPSQPDDSFASPASRREQLPLRRSCISGRAPRRCPPVGPVAERSRPPSRR